MNIILFLVLRDSRNKA